MPFHIIYERAEPSVFAALHKIARDMGLVISSCRQLKGDNVDEEEDDGVTPRKASSEKGGESEVLRCMHL